MNVGIKPLEGDTLTSDSTNTVRTSKQSKRITGDSLLNYININPGIRYRELLRLSGFGNGVLTYHLFMLERKGKIRVHRIRTEDNKILSFANSG